MGEKEGGGRKTRVTCELGGRMGDAHGAMKYLGAAGVLGLPWTYSERGDGIFLRRGRDDRLLPALL